ncbi:hypothetical protein MF406_14215 [Georgenia sp. TF02-10]|uniref:hypothetical protein n=1 Tax=Georgenia sp. TF02-10 TaxID=2917725 RepID=UPI001FA7B954|nr:hypothetical protein [Georgenia sp. TF02-10]UNX54087.1 hypothetical protein MF406_14215 [Georgenia sp. TF02-10]
MSPLMRSPEGEERDIKPAGVAALSRLGWKAVQAKDEKKPPVKRPARPRKPAAKPDAR